MRGKKIDLGLTGYDELFMDDKGRAEAKLPRIYDIPLSEIDDFPDHPFQVRMDEDMEQLVESVKERGIITPITLRQKEDGRYELVSGHRRKKACELAGFETIKAEIHELSRDEAIILMVESNLQRSVTLPSKKAFSYILISQITILLTGIATVSVLQFRISWLIVMVLGGIGGGMAGRVLNRKWNIEMVDTLFFVLILVIIGISCYNAWHLLKY